MGNRSFGVSCLIFVLLIGMVAGCQRQEDRVQGNDLPPPVQATQPPPSEAPSVTPSQTPLKDALEQEFASAMRKGSHSAIPAGTQLISVKLEDGVATVDVSKEFNALANHGESTESKAQKELRAILAQFPNVKQMRLTVEGKPFDSQVTDWYTPFPVRDTDRPDNNISNRDGGRSRR